MVKDSGITKIKMTYTGLAPVKVAGVSPPADKKTGKKKERIETGDVVAVPEAIARNLQHDPNWDSVQKIEMKYTGSKGTTGKVPGGPEVKPGKTTLVPEAIALFLDKNKNWSTCREAANRPPTRVGQEASPAGDQEEKKPPAGETPPDPEKKEPRKDEEKKGGKQ